MRKPANIYSGTAIKGNESIATNIRWTITTSGIPGREISPSTELNPRAIAMGNPKAKNRKNDHHVRGCDEDELKNDTYDD